jgi:hypothetical protein
MHEGFVKPFAKAPGMAFLFFSPDEPGRLIRRIEAACRKNGDAATSLLMLRTTSRSLGVPVAALVKAVLDGDLRAARISKGGVGLSRYLVDVDEAASLVLSRPAATHPCPAGPVLSGGLAGQESP